MEPPDPANYVDINRGPLCSDLDFPMRNELPTVSIRTPGQCGSCKSLCLLTHTVRPPGRAPGWRGTYA